MLRWPYNLRYSFVARVVLDEQEERGTQPYNRLFLAITRNLSSIDGAQACVEAVSVAAEINIAVRSMPPRYGFIKSMRYNLNNINHVWQLPQNITKRKASLS